MVEIHIKCCGECPNFEAMIEEYDNITGRYLSKGRCIKFKPYPSIEDEILETRLPCAEMETLHFYDNIEEAWARN